MKKLIVLLVMPVLYFGQTIKSNPNLGIMFAKTPLISADFKTILITFLMGLRITT